MTHDQAAADRERIRIEMKSRGAPACLEMAPTLDAAVRAFEVLCEPRGYSLCREQTAFNGTCTWMARARLNNDRAWIDTNGTGRIDATLTGSHAADVCRLVCEVLDRERAEAPQTPCQAD